MPDELIFLPVSVSFVFLLVNVVILAMILGQNRRADDKPREQAATPGQGVRGEKVLSASDILDWEFEYARTTASEAMQDRHTMVNFYLLVAGILVSGVVALLGQDAGFPEATGTVLLWLLCGIGWLYFLKIIRLRQAWHDSAQTMNQIKEFYIQHTEEFDPDVLRTAFRWQAQTLPAPDKPWTVFFYSGLLIGLLDSVAYVAGGVLLDRQAVRFSPSLVLGSLALFGLAFFAFHVWLYFAFLKPSGETTRDAHNKDG